MLCLWRTIAEQALPLQLLILGVSMIRVDIKDMQKKIKVDRKFIRRVVRETLKREAKGGEVSIVLTHNEYIRQLNRKYRSVDRATDVLAFPMDEEILGDIVISLEKAKEQALVYRESFKNEVGRLVIHGILHLIGYDDSSRGSLKKMHAREEEILKEILSC